MSKPGGALTQMVFPYITIRMVTIDGYSNVKYEIINNKTKDQIGFIMWYSQWKRYVFTQSKERVVWSDDCLDNISKFLKELNK